MNEEISETFNRTLTWLSGRKALVGFTAGLGAGFVVLGLGGRFVMSLIALALGQRLDWSWGGSVQVIVLGTALGPAGGLLLAAIQDRLPGSTPIKGVIFGGLFGGVWTAIYFLRPAGPVELLVSPVLGSVLFGGLLVLFGVALTATVSLLETHTANARTSRPAVGFLVVLATLFAAGLGLYALVSR
jgi:hypothetical protein